MRRAAHDVVKLPIEFSFILSRVFSLKVATFCSNPFEHVYFMVSIFRMYCKFTSKLVTFANNKMVSGIAVAPYIIS